MKLCGIYLITHVESGRKYIGQSVDIRRRLLIHASGFRQSWIGKAVLKYGWAAFRTEILELCARESLNASECKWITTHNCIAPNGFNLTTGGRQQFEVSESTREKLRKAGANISQETRAKIGAASKGRIFSAESIAQRVAKMIGKKRSAETRAKQSTAGKGRIFSAEHLAKLSAAQKARMADHECRRRLSELNTGKTHSPEACAKMSLSRTGLKRSAEAIAKTSASLIGRKHSDATRAKLSASAKLRYTSRERNSSTGRFL